MVPLAHATSEGSGEPAHPHSLARGINARISFFTQFSEKLFCMQTTKAQISQRTCAVLRSSVSKRADPDNSNRGGGGRGGGRSASRGRFYIDCHYHNLRMLTA